MEAIGERLDYLWFLDYVLDDKIPDHWDVNDVFDKIVFAAGLSVQNQGGPCYAPSRHRFRERSSPAASAAFSAASAGVLPCPYPPAVEPPRCNRNLPPVFARSRVR